MAAKPDRHPSLPPEDLPLAEASVQEIQLELIRRRRFNCFDGPKVVASLRQHRSLWRAVMMDRLGFVSKDGTSANWGLIKLRDLPGNYWNVDDLYILTDTLEQAMQFERIAEQEDWKANNVTLIREQRERSMALGTSEPGYVISFWWD
jgi:hypothetical protein